MVRVLLRKSTIVAFLLIALVTVGLGASSAPKPGFVTVIGSAAPGASHDDRGAPPQLQGLALKHSGAELGYINVSRDSALDPLLASGKELSAYVYSNQSEVSYYYSKGVRLFVFGNEPDGDWGTYGSILQQAYPLFQTDAPGSTVIGANCFGVSPYDGLYRYYDLKGNCDKLGFHNYSNDPATGLDVSSVVSVHNTMNSWGDGSKLMFLGEGWGPKREITNCARIAPEEPPSNAEIQAMRDFVVNGWRNATTTQGGYDPNWVYGVLFFTLSDNWGGNYSHFYNGGITDIWGNSKDDLVLLFPGNKLTVSNCGFEYFTAGRPQGPPPSWSILSRTSDACYALDATIRHSGHRSQRIELSGTNEAYVHQTTQPGSISAGQHYTFAAWARTEGVLSPTQAGVRLRMRFLDSSWSSVGSDAWSPALKGTNGWTLLSVAATAPSGAVMVRGDCNIQGTAGRAWFDDCGVSPASSPQTGAIEGYALRTDNVAISGAAVTIQPGNLSATTDSSGRFYVSGLQAGTYEVSAVKAGFARWAVSRIAVAPGRTSPAGLNLPGQTDGAPLNVDVTSPGTSGVLKVTWEAPAGAIDYYHVYRSTTSGSLGSSVADNLTELYFWDSNLTDYQRYYYTVRKVSSGVESTNIDSRCGVSTGGQSSVVYDVAASPAWSNWATEHGQTFVPAASGSIISATCVLATAGEPRNRTITFSIRDGGPAGAQIGTSKAVICYSDEIGTARWSGGEVPVVAGHTYYLRLVASSGTNIYRTKDNVYGSGYYYRDGVAYSPSVDLWSSIAMVESSAVETMNISATSVGAGQMEIAWETSAPSTTQVEYGSATAYGNWSPYYPGWIAQHEVTLTGLLPGDYHFRVKSTRDGLPEAYSLDYTFTEPPYAAYSLAEVRGMPDGSLVRMTGLVTTSGSSDLSGLIYASDPNRTAGIRVIPASAVTAVNPGDAVEVQGMLETVNGERRLSNAVVTVMTPS